MAIIAGLSISALFTTPIIPPYFLIVGIGGTITISAVIVVVVVWRLRKRQT
ncbi:MAG: hypothetical protein ACFE89_12280 [Candidatus Hodarchaeota archaeon]